MAGGAHQFIVLVIDSETGGQISVITLYHQDAASAGAANGTQLFMAQ